MRAPVGYVQRALKSRKTPFKRRYRLSLYALQMLYIGNTGTKAYPSVCRFLSRTYPTLRRFLSLVLSSMRRKLARYTLACAAFCRRDTPRLLHQSNRKRLWHVRKITFLPWHDTGKHWARGRGKVSRPDRPPAIVRADGRIQRKDSGKFLNNLELGCIPLPKGCLRNEHRDSGKLAAS